MSSLFNIFNEIVIDNNNNNNNNNNNDNNNNNNNNNNIIIIAYLKANCTMKSYKKLFKKKQKRTRKNNKNNKYIYNSNMFAINNNERYKCESCKMSFINNAIHNFIMNDKCPNINKMNQSILIETIYETQYKTHRIVKPNLTVELKKNKKR